MKVAILYTSITGNTKVLSEWLYHSLNKFSIDITMYSIAEFNISTLEKYNGILIGTYTWGNGNIPKVMEDLYTAFANYPVQHIITGVFGTGDRFYPNYCGAVDQFRDMLFVHTQLAVTLKVELLPQAQDRIQCKNFVELFIKRLNSNSTRALIKENV